MGCPFHPSATFEERQFPRGRPRGRVIRVADRVASWASCGELSGVRRVGPGGCSCYALHLPSESFV